MSPVPRAWASQLHRALARGGYQRDQHYEAASFIAQRPIASLTELSPAEAREVMLLARDLARR